MSESVKIIATHRKARHLYEILDTWEAGIVLKGSEVKSLRQGKVSFVDSFAKVENGEIWIYNLHIPPYDKSSYFNHEPLRKRKLLFHKMEINKIQFKTEAKGLSLVPLKVYFKRGYVKLELAIVRGKKIFDKRESIAKRDTERRMEREKSDRNS